MIFAGIARETWSKSIEFRKLTLAAGIGEDAALVVLQSSLFLSVLTLPRDNKPFDEADDVFREE